MYVYVGLFRKINILLFYQFFVTELYFVSVLKEPIPYQTLNIELKMKKSNCALKEVVLRKYFRMTFFQDTMKIQNLNILYRYGAIH